MELRTNRDIRALKVRVIGEDGSQLGILSTRDALVMAQQAGLDLVEISPSANPPVCKIIDFGKFRYQKTKKERESKKQQHQVKIKEIKVKPNIDVHDYQTKLNQGKDFLERGDKLRITCSFRGRELLHTELGERVVDKFCQDLKEFSLVEAPMKKIGRTVTLVLAPAGKKSVKKSTHSQEERREGDKNSAKDENEEST